jgi:hypothetical protein
MKKSLVVASVAAAFGWGMATASHAHHSFAAVYDMSEPLTIQGTLVQVRLTNPHSWFYLDVENDDGEIERWSFEAGTPGGMIRNGYSKDAIPNGTVVTITGFPARDRSANSGMLRQLVTEDGNVYGMFGPQEGPGARGR